MFNAIYNVKVETPTGTHLWMLNDLMPPAMQRYHALINLAAAGSIAYGLYV